MYLSANPLLPGHPLHELFYSHFDKDLIQFLQTDVQRSKERVLPRCPKPVIVEVKNENWKQFTPPTQVATDFLKSMQEGKIPTFLHKLPGHLKLVPKPLKHYVEDVILHGPQHASSKLFNSHIIRPPSRVRHYMSGSTHKSLQFRDPHTGSFIASLFHMIQHQSVTSVELTGWDLYHGHFFVSVHEEVELLNKNDSEREGSDGKNEGDKSKDKEDKEGKEDKEDKDKDKETKEDKEDEDEEAGDQTKGDEEKPKKHVVCDLGILFHGKEFPKEYRSSQYGPTYPIGSPEMRGNKDPRIGTKCSLEDPDFSCRNYLWLMSTNRIYMIDTHEEGFPPEMLCNSEFFTVSEGFFSRRMLGDVNYFPGIFSNKDVGPVPTNIIEHERKRLEEMKDAFMTTIEEDEQKKKKEKKKKAKKEGKGEDKGQLDENKDSQNTEKDTTKNTTTTTTTTITTTTTVTTTTTITETTNTERESEGANNEAGLKSKPTTPRGEANKTQPESPKSPKIRTSARKVMAEKKTNFWYIYYAEQIQSLVAHSTWASMDVLACPRDGFTPLIMAKHHLRGLKDLIGKLDLQDLEALQTAINTPERDDSQDSGYEEDGEEEEEELRGKEKKKEKTKKSKDDEDKIEELAVPLLSFWIEQQRKKEQEALAKRRDVQRVKLEESGVPPELALRALKLTENETGEWSEFRSRELLATAFLKYRSPDLTSTFTQDYELEEVLSIWKLAFYAANALEAIQLIEARKGKEKQLTPKQAVDKVIHKKNKKLWKKIDAEEKAKRESQQEQQ
eukprot:TRINITY_DN876_c0_g1_i2.p1 TRINITY_DN876_c0_g1~~TRINITY_DN876_c0_g1_i2.p1  ORF type:complete len:784 (+),score=189.41 TRINITY_DN876_c0_g1_i2:194-2545(+)